jgi:HSP20 family protein
MIKELIMLDSLKQARRNLSRGFSRTLEHIAEGWRELVHRSSDALTHFTHSKHEVTAPADKYPAFPNWSLLAGEIEETDKDIVVRVEAPGMEKEDCHVTVDGSMLRIKGEKRFERATSDSTYHVMERAYGVFERTIPLPATARGGRGQSGGELQEWRVDGSSAKAGRGERSDNSFIRQIAFW